MHSYRQARSKLDPGWFEGAIQLRRGAYRLRNYNQSLAAYEMALAIQPDSAGALQFRAGARGGGLRDRRGERVGKNRAANPNEVRAHLAWKSYAQQLYGPCAGPAALFERCWK